MRFKNDNDNRYRVNFMRATEALIDKMTVAEFIEYLENNAELEDESTHIYIDGKTIWCKDYVLKETYKLRKEFLVSEDGSRLFYAISVTKRAELVDDSTEAAADNTEAISWEQQSKAVTLTNELCSTLQCYILMTTNYRKGEIEAWEKLAQETDENGAPKFKNAASNAQYVLRHLHINASSLKAKQQPQGCICNFRGLRGVSSDETDIKIEERRAETWRQTTQ